MAYHPTKTIFFNISGHSSQTYFNVSAVSAYYDYLTPSQSEILQPAYRVNCTPETYNIMGLNILNTMLATYDTLIHIHIFENIGCFSYINNCFYCIDDSIVQFSGNGTYFNNLVPLDSNGKFQGNFNFSKSYRIGLQNA